MTMTSYDHHKKNISFSWAILWLKYWTILKNDCSRRYWAENHEDYAAVVCWHISKWTSLQLQSTVTTIPSRLTELLFSVKELATDFVHPPVKHTGGDSRLVSLGGLTESDQGTVLAVTHIARCCHLPAVHRCGRSLAEPSWSRKCLGYVSPLQSECSPDCSRTYIEHIHLNETGQRDRTTHQLVT